jgi:lysosomal Pro-X carboxypeptidase
MAMKNRQADWDAVSTTFKTCSKISKTGDLDNLYRHLSGGFSYMAMTNYPYESSFLEPMPGNPVSVACQAFKDVPAPTEEK